MKFLSKDIFHFSCDVSVLRQKLSIVWGRSSLTLFDILSNLKVSHEERNVGEKNNYHCEKKELMNE